MIVSGTSLFVNVDAPRGEVRVEVLDAAGQVIAPFSLARCRPVSADATQTQVRWAGVEDLAALRGRAVTFRFRLTNGALYAFWVGHDDCGDSNGYPGAGRPGLSVPLDRPGSGGAGPPI